MYRERHSARCRLERYVMEGFILVMLFFVPFLAISILGLAFAYGLVKESHILDPK